MNIVIKRELLCEKLTDLNSIVERKTSSPILSHVLLIVDEKGLQLLATDTEMSLRVYIPASEIEIKANGAITVAANGFLDIVRLQPLNSFIECKVEKEQFVVTCNSSVTKLSTFPAVDFPQPEQAQTDNTIRINSRTLANLFDSVSFSMADRDARIYLNGLLLNVVNDGEALDAVTSDGSRLSCAQAQLSERVNPNTKIILPRKAVNELKKQISRTNEEITLSFGTRHLSLEIGNNRFTTRLIDATYANYAAVIPTRSNPPILIPHGEFAAALSKMKSRLTENHETGVVITIREHNMHLLARNSLNETTEDNVDIVNPENIDREIRLDVNFLTDITKHLNSENLKFYLSDVNGAGLFTGSEDNGCLYIVMSMRM